MHISQEVECTRVSIRPNNLLLNIPVELMNNKRPCGRLAAKLMRLHNPRSVLEKEERL